jgi:hypothetical protein
MGVLNRTSNRVLDFCYGCSLSGMQKCHVGESLLQLHEDDGD